MTALGGQRSEIFAPSRFGLGDGKTSPLSLCGLCGVFSRLRTVSLKSRSVSPSPLLRSLSMHRYRVRPFLSQAYYIAIGRAIVTWAALEIRIDEHILRMLRHPNARSIRERDKIHLLDHIPKALKKRLGLFDELVRVIYEDEPLREFTAISKRCLALSKNRHRLAHGEWLTEYLPHKTEITSRMWRAGRPGKSQQFTVPQIRALTHQICGVYADLYKLSSAYPPRPLAEEMREFFEARLSRTNP